MALVIIIIIIGVVITITSIIITIVPTVITMPRSASFWAASQAACDRGAGAMIG